MSLEPAVRSRFGGSKVRTGCLTCKARHVKCDENKPHCDRCRRAGRKCDGYALPNQNQGKLRRDLIIINYVAPSKGVSLLPAADPREQRSQDYFRTRMVPELGYLFNSELWSRFILQTAHHEPAIRHAITALGSLHEHFESFGDAHATETNFGFQQYIKAIQCVVKDPTPLATQSTDVALVSCILFTAFESLQGHYRSALTHINSGLKLLAEREASGDAQHAPYIPKDLLTSLFTRFDIQALEIGDVAFRPWVRIRSVTEIKIPSTFSTLEEAERVFDQYFNVLMHFLQSAGITDKEGPPVSDDTLHALAIQHPKLVQEYYDWCNAFDKYLALHLADDNSPTSLLRGQPHPGVLILQIWRIAVWILLHVDLSAGELVFDTFLEQWRCIVGLAESFVRQAAIPSRTPGVLDRVSLTRLECQSAPAEAAQPTRLNTKPRPWSGSCASHGFLGIQPYGTPCIAADAAASDTSAKADPCLRTAYMNGMETSTSTAGLANIVPKPLTILKPTFSLSLGLISPLYMIVSRCRDPTTRRRALHLLYTCNRKEGIWDSRLAARVGQRIIEVEEAGATSLPSQGSSNGSETVGVVSADQIPENARIHELEVSFLADRKGRIRYTKSTGGGIPKPEPTGYYEEILHW